MATTVDAEETFHGFFTWAYKQGWTDGLPIVPPTPDLVQEMMSTVDLAADHVVAHVPPKRAPATVEALAANAVMAGCLPEYFPVVVAAVEAAVLEDGYNANSCNVTTNPVAPMIVINGPIRNEIGVNCSWGCLGPGTRANATIGRALNLAMLNIGGRVPGQVSKSTHAHPGRYTFCFGEYEEESPWAPLHVERGFSADKSTLTIIGVTGSINVVDMDSHTGEEVLRTMASSIMVIGSNNVFPGYAGHDMTVIWCPDHAKTVAKSFTKEQAKEYLLEATSKIPVGWQTKQRLERIAEQSRGQLEGEYFRLTDRVDRFVFVVAGGGGGLHSVACHGFSPRSITVPIRHRKK